MDTFNQVLEFINTFLLSTTVRVVEDTDGLAYTFTVSKNSQATKLRLSLHMGSTTDFMSARKLNLMIVSDQGLESRYLNQYVPEEHTEAVSRLFMRLKRLDRDNQAKIREGLLTGFTDLITQPLDGSQNNPHTQYIGVRLVSEGETLNTVTLHRTNSTGAIYGKLSSVYLADLTRATWGHAITEGSTYHLSDMVSAEIISVHTTNEYLD